MKLELCPVCGGDWLAILMASGKLCDGCGGSGRVTEARHKELIDDVAGRLLAMVFNQK